MQRLKIEKAAGPDGVANECFFFFCLFKCEVSPPALQAFNYRFDS